MRAAARSTACTTAYTPLGGLVPLFNIQTDEVIFGGVGSGLYGMLLYAIVAVFIAGLMVGRTPEYLGKKIQQKEVKMAMLPILATSFLILVFTAVSVVVPFAKDSYWNPPGPGDREPEQRRPARLQRDAVRLLERARRTTAARSPASTSTRLGTTSRSAWRCCSGGSCSSCPFWLSRAAWRPRRGCPSSSGTLPTHGPLFVGLLVATVIVVGALTFFPALALGPMVEHFLMHQGKALLP